MKQEGCELDQKTVLSLIEHLQFEGKLNRLLQLLEELKDPDFWFDGCERVVIYCVRHKHLSSAINLLKQLMDRDKMSIYAVLDQMNEEFDMKVKDLVKNLRSAILRL
ncbi:hypothetical protein FRX31_007873 [Thalictrum thalictroides]|uniref:Pentatricopeptide repeat-containing protein n=1 Tax=Thalictrum thalictroides TaxID=46969 RepID=A0A7J6X1E6_THATH|nr:hypothetical protein FRX31_007873 [Thalictrum thalictroides]